MAGQHERLSVRLLLYILLGAGVIVLAAALNFWPQLETDEHDRRPLVAGSFGLLHGLGFASVLGEFGLPSLQVVPALLGFNVGVEIGQLTVIALAFLLTLPVLQRAGEGGYRRYLAVPASVVIALVGAYWFVQRAFA